MTDGSVPFADYERIREAVAEHFVMWHNLTIPGAAQTWTTQGPPGEWRCACGLKFGFSDSAIDHVADVITRLGETPQDLNRCPGSLRPPRPASATNTTVGMVGTCPRCGRIAKLRRDGLIAPHQRREQVCCPGDGSMAHVRGCVNHPEAGR